MRTEQEIRQRKDELYNKLIHHEVSADLDGQMKALALIGMQNEYTALRWVLNDE
jgi:hypothetical protein